MLFGRFTKLPNHKRFNYAPRHFDPEEEERQERYRLIEAQVKSDRGEQELRPSERALRISQAFRKERPSRNLWSAQGSATFRIRLSIVAFLLGFGYLYWNYGDRIGEIVMRDIFSQRGLIWFAILLVVYFLIRSRRK